MPCSADASRNSRPWRERTRSSSRTPDLHVEIAVDHEKVAESRRPVLLDETGLPTVTTYRVDVRAECSASRPHEHVPV